MEGYFGNLDHGCASLCQVGLYQSVAGIGVIGVRWGVVVGDQKAPPGGPAEKLGRWVIWSRDVQIDFDGQDHTIAFWSSGTIGEFNGHDGPWRIKDYIDAPK